jgi:hypothetical protein
MKTGELKRNIPQTSTRKARPNIRVGEKLPVFVAENMRYE